MEQCKEMLRIYLWVSQRRQWTQQSGSKEEFDGPELKWKSFVKVVSHTFCIARQKVWWYPFQNWLQTWKFCTKLVNRVYPFISTFRVTRLQSENFKSHFQKTSKSNWYLSCIEAAFPCAQVTAMPCVFSSSICTCQSIFHRPDFRPDTTVVITLFHVAVYACVFHMAKRISHLHNDRFVIKCNVQQLHIVPGAPLMEKGRKHCTEKHSGFLK